MREPSSSMSRLRVTVEDERGSAAARVASRWIVLVQQHARARDDLAAGFSEPADVLARNELANQARARRRFDDRRLSRRQLAHVLEHVDAMPCDDGSVRDRGLANAIVG